jgi:hypothetical protein
VRIIHRRLIAEGRAVWLGETFPDRPPPAPLDDVPRAVARVRALFEEAVATASEKTSESAGRVGARQVDRQAEAAPS